MSSPTAVQEKHFQEYLQALADVSEKPAPKRVQHLLASYAELRYRMHGGGHCAACNAHVRHVLAVRVIRSGGAIAIFDCLCNRCLEGERAVAESVHLGIGDGKWPMKV